MFFGKLFGVFNKKRGKARCEQQVSDHIQDCTLDTDRVTLTQQAIQWVVDTCTPICSTDFIGYLFELGMVSKRYKKLGGALDVFGGFMIFSLDEKNPHIDNKKVMRIYNHLFDIDFLVIQESCPFEEFDEVLCGDVPIDYETTQFIEEPIFHSIARKRRYSGHGNGIEYTNPISIDYM